MQGVEYSWEEWFGMKWKKVKQGRDFDCMLHSMSVLIRQAAAKRGLAVSIQIDEENKTLTFTTKGDL